jgi:acetyl esterase/lipase
MPIGYAIMVAVVAWGVVCALRSRPIVRGPMVVPATLTSQLPFAAALLLILSTALTLGEGDLGSPVGLVAAAIAGLCLVGLASVVRRTLGGRAAVERGLDEGLGTGWRALAGTRRRPWARILGAPIGTVVAPVRRESVAYGDAGRRNRLDVYRRRGDRTGAPVLLHFHGGGFHSGNKRREARPIIFHLASQGWLCVSANYRLRPRATAADQAVDVARAIAWVRRHAPGYGADPDQLFLMGSSAGAYLATDAVFAGARAAGVICRYGYYGALEPPGPELPPFLVIHGDRDLLVPVADARGFADRVRAVSRTPVATVVLPGAHHPFDLCDSLTAAAALDAVVAFTAWVRAGRPRAAGVEPPRSGPAAA